MKLKVNIRELIEDNAHNGELQVNACVDVEELFECNAIPEEQEIDVDIHELLAERRQIAHIWGIEDVKGIRPDLSEEQAWEVLENVDRHKDTELGITWLTLEMAAKHLFGEAPETDEMGEE